MSQPLLGKTRPGKQMASFAQAVVDGEVCVVVGAGPSQELNVPGWDGLVAALGRRQRLWRRRRPPRGSNLPLAVELLRISEEDQKRWVAELWHSRAPANWIHSSGGQPGLPAFAETAHAHLASLAIQIAGMSPKQPFHAISYNYDTLLEEALAALGARAEAITMNDRMGWAPRRTQATWKGRSLRGLPAKVRVLHPHGLLPRPIRRWRSSPRPVPGDPVILSATSYSERRRQPSHPMNMAQIEAFGGRRCLLYGFSMQDEWVRELAEMANSGAFGVEYPRHIILTKGESAPGIAAPELSHPWTLHLAERGFARVITPDYGHQKYWLRLLLNEVRRASSQ